VVIPCARLLVMVVVMLLAAQAHAGAVLQRIAGRGLLNVCSNIENRPFAYLNPSGAAQGFNIDLADDLRARLSSDLGQPLRLGIIATSGANRVPFLNQGKCDVIITGFSATPERQRLVDFISPNFYSSGAVLLAHRDQSIDSWESLRGKAVCSSHGSIYNQAVAEQYGIRILAFAGLTESAQALRDRRCVGQVMDEAVARLRLANQREWAQFEIKLPTILEIPWNMAIAHGDREFGQLLEGHARAWREQGLIEALENRYGLPHKPVLAVSAPAADARDAAIIPRGLHHLATQAQQFYARTGWDFVVLYDGWSARQFIHGIGTTVKLALICIAASCIIGLTGALAAYGPRPLRWLVQGYVELLRNTPSLAQLYFLYFGLGSLLRGAPSGAALPWYANAFTLAATCISLHYGAFAVDIVRAGFGAVPVATRDAALALGYGPWGRMRHVLIPIALRASLPALGNNMVQVIKGTSIAYAIAVPELLYSAQEIWNDRHNVVEMMLLVLLSYLGLMAVLAVALGRLERRLRLPGVEM